MMQEGPYAHTPRCGSEEWHGLVDHSKAVATLSGEFARAFGAEHAATCVGWAHDAAKSDPRFQQYLQDVFRNRPYTKCPHAYAGAVAAYKKVNFLSLVIAGHHAGLSDSNQWISKGSDPKSVEAAKNFLNEIAPDWSEDLAIPEWVTRDLLSAELFVRMVFSCLVDADRLDTEAHMEQMPLNRGQFPDLRHYLTKLRAHQQSFSSKGPVNEVRAEVLKYCIGSADQEPGVFTLTVPTGGGKTLSGLTFALEHAVRNSQRRVIVAIPFTSIIDQTAKIYADIFGEQNVLEHHSAVEIEESEDASIAEVKKRLAAENWDCPLVVTTTVQLFESLLSNRPSKCRKLHRVAKSVLIIDEVQSLPEKHLGPVLDVLTELVKNYGVTVVLSTATPPDYSPVDSRLLDGALEIVPDHEVHFAALQRARFEVRKSPITKETLMQELDVHDQALVILNSRLDAAELADAARGLKGTYHLSTLMCVHHRKQVLDEVRARLANQLPVRLISTQVVEAGVDVDFPRVYRAMAPLDNIIQAAGRCNREGRMEGKGICVVFELDNERAPRGGYRTGTAMTKPFLDKYGDQITMPYVTKSFTAEYFRRVETGAENSNSNAVIQKLRRELAFKTVAENFRMIDEDSVPLVVEKYPEYDVPALLANWRENPRSWHRTMAQFSVSLYKMEVNKLQREGLVHEHESGALVYHGSYDVLLGVRPDQANAEHLIV